MQDHQTTPPGGGSERSAGVSQLDQALWKQLAEATTQEQFTYAWLGLQARQIGGVSGGVVVLEESETRALDLAAVWPRGFEAERLAEAVERVVRERKGVVLRGDPAEPAAGEEARFRLAYPIAVGGVVRGVAALLITPRPHAELQTAMRQLQWGAAWLQNWVFRQTAAPEARLANRLRGAMELAGLVLEEPKFRSAATAVVTELASRLNCDRVSIGFMKRGQVKVQALSHSAMFGKQMNLIRSIGLAMGEAVDQQSVMVFPEPDGAARTVLHAHEQLAQTHGDAAICTVPFVDHTGHAFGALTFERAAADPFDEETVELCDSVAALIGPILEEKRLNDRLLITKIGDSLWTQLKRLFGPRYALRKVIAAAIAIVVVFFIFAKGTYRVAGDATLEGEVKRVVAAPFRGFIAEAPVRAGDIVSKGETLCSLDVRDLRLEYSRWSSEREQYMLEHRRAMAEGDRAAMNVLSKKMRQAEAQVALLQEQLDRATITSPFNGLVVSGDLSQALGAPVDEGQVLYEVAPLDSYRVMLQVDEKDIEDVQTGQSGELVVAAMPDTGFGFTVQTLTPVSLTEEGRNYFMVEARLDEMSPRLRPGMEGYGKVRVDRRRLVWIWTHDMFDWVRLKAWRWLP